MTTATATPTRRTVLQALGATGAVALAGCLADDSPDPAATPDDDDDGLRAAKDIDIDRIAADPTDLPPPVDWDEPRTHEITLETIEVTAEVAPGVTVDFMTYDGRIPGPMIRVREGDTIELTFEVPDDHNKVAHNVDFHAVYGPGGGAVATTVAPGDEPARLRFKAEYAGAFVYHCAVPAMDQHISLGMFGAILVEPADGLPEVDREFYFGQHELYTAGDTGEEGHHYFDFDSAADEDPTYVLLNGEVGAITEDGHGPVAAEVGETVRVYYANGGPNLISALHPIGNVWSRYYRDGDLLSDPARNVETSPVAPGTVVAGEMELRVPGPIKLVDHALSRVTQKGMIGVIDVQGEPNPEVYDDDL
ncbi:copper-containing nitrite reductase [Natronorubrum sp. FCH18a]|uniref:copper-containing nitrite reductase n=1 Tax=Natronorubrum sp. FCH18a TaxID=3447018 RepID=UPI003F518356